MNGRAMCAVARVLTGASVLCGCSADTRDGAQDVAVISIEPETIIGVVQGDSAYLFGDVRSVTGDDAGRIYVSDRIGPSVRVYDRSGQYLKRIARGGRGPGEIQGMAADVTAADGRLYTRDVSRITVFVPREESAVPDSAAEIWPLRTLGNMSSTRSRVGDDGAYFYPGDHFRDGELPRFFYLPFRGGEPTGDTLEVPRYPGLAALRIASYRMDAGGGRLLHGLSHVPFAPVPSWGVTPSGTILSSSGADYVIVETGLRGDTIRVITGPSAAAVPVPAGEKADSARALAARLDTLPVPLDRVVGLGPGVRERRLPETLPPVLGIHVAADGAIWVERWPAEGETEARFYDVLDSSGRLLRRVVLRAQLVRDPPPFFGADYVVGVVRDEDTGIDRVVRFSLSAAAQVPRE